MPTGVGDTERWDLAVIGALVMVAARSGNDGATGAALQPGGRTRGRRYGCRARWARCPCRGCDTPRSTVGACSAESGGGFVWPVTLRSVGGADARWITGHVAAAQPVVDWGGNPRHSARPPALWNLIPGVNSIRLLQQGGEISQPAPGERSRPTRGVRARSAIRHTARYEGASASSTPDSGPADPARGRRAEHTTRRSDGAAHYAPPTAATRCRRCSPARQACRADPTPPAAEPDPKPASPRHPPTVPAVQQGYSATRSDHAPSTHRVAQRHPYRGLRCADRPY
jgi:hypothetical protein